MQAVLQRFADSLPHKPYCSNDLMAGTRILPRHLALTRKYIQPQISKKLIGWMIYDIDRPGAAHAWDDADLPAPTITVINPINKHAHLLYQLTAPIPTTDKARLQPIRYLNAIEHAYKLRLGADFGYAGLLTKNPMHQSWLVSANDVSYELSVLAEYVELKRMDPKEARGLGRNCTIFDEVRQLSYREVHKHSSHDTFQRQVILFCHQLNDAFPMPLAQRELGVIAKSISRWTWRHRHEVGLISLDAINRIKIAANAVCADVDVSFVCKVAQKEVARVSGLSTDTIQRFIQFFKQ